MIWKNTESRYGIIAKGFHWLIALAVIGMLGAGLYMVGLDLTPFKFKIYGLHKAVGITIFALVILRFVWRFVNMQPADIKTHKKWERVLSKTIHAFLYVAMIGMPLSGWIMSSAANYPVSVFGLFTLPDLVEPDKELGDVMKQVHSVLSYMLIGGIGLHIAGALKHHIIDKDETLKRMVS